MLIPTFGVNKGEMVHGFHSLVVTVNEVRVKVFPYRVPIRATEARGIRDIFLHYIVPVEIVDNILILL